MDTLRNTIFNTDRYTSNIRKEQANLLYGMVTIVLVAIVVIDFFLPLGADGTTLIQTALESGFSLAVSMSILLIIATVATIGLVRFGRYTMGAWLINVVLFLLVAATAYTGFDADFEVFGLVFLLVLSAVTLRELGFAIIGSASTVLFIASFYVAANQAGTDVEFSPIGMATLLAFIALVYTFIRFLQVSRTEGRVTESAERFKLAEINTRITRQASERISLDETLNNTLQMILENYRQIYHAQVFLINDDGIQARLVASTGETGQQLIQKGHSLAVGSLSVIGQTTFKGEPVIARSNDQNSVHRENQLLPQTRVEAAFPMQISDNIIGALDLQSREDLILGEFDMLTFQSLANSLSLAIDNIRQFEAAKTRVEENQRLAEQTRNALREVERLNQRLIGRAWSEYLSGKGDQLGLNIELDTNEVESVPDWTESLRNAAQSGGIVQEENIIAVPLHVRGVIVGAMEFELGAEGEFTPADMELVQEVSERFGLAAENTRLVEESQRIAQRESLINEISTRLQSANNVEATLAEAARSLSDTLQANKVTIRLGIPEPKKQSKPHTNGATE